MSFETKDIGSYDHPFIGFGIDQKKAVDQLRHLADEIEAQHSAKDNFAGEYIILQSAATEYSTHVNEYSMTTITLKFATKKRELPRRVEEGTQEV